MALGTYDLLFRCWGKPLSITKRNQMPPAPLLPLTGLCNAESHKCKADCRLVSTFIYCPRTSTWGLPLRLLFAFSEYGRAPTPGRCLGLSLNCRFVLGGRLPTSLRSHPAAHPPPSEFHAQHMSYTAVRLSETYPPNFMKIHPILFKGCSNRQLYLHRLS